MKEITQVLWNYKISLAIIIIFFILLYQFFEVQGQAWIILSIFFWFFLLAVIGEFLFHGINQINNYLSKSGRMIYERANSWKDFWKIMITVMVVVISVIGYFDIGVPFLVNFKANINNSYIQDVVEEITEGETTNHGKISALLRWFNGTDTMINLWNSVDQGKKIWNYNNLFYILSEPER
jgi:hypothetical protein